jgi:hypothetical protein
MARAAGSSLCSGYACSRYTGGVPTSQETNKDEIESVAISLQENAKACDLSCTLAQLVFRRGVHGGTAAAFLDPVRALLISGRSVRSSCVHGSTAAAFRDLFGHSSSLDVRRCTYLVRCTYLEG